MANTDTKTTPLCDLFAKYGADKCPQILHSYSPAYFDILNPIRDEVTTLLEIGVGNKTLMSSIVGDHYVPGASLRAWSDFFKGAKIYSCDIDKSVLFFEDNIKCFYMDQSSEESIKKCIQEIKTAASNNNLCFDIIIDDGSHIKNHMVLTHLVLKDYLAPNGVYIIEDIKLEDLDEFVELHNRYNDVKLEYVHKGYNYWDSFVAYRKK